MEHKVSSRFDKKYKQDRCPNCKFMDQNFIFISDKELACYNCGIMFINKESREAMKKVSLEMLLKQGQEKREYPCDKCDFVAKNGTGLIVHQKAKHRE